MFGPHLPAAMQLISLREGIDQNKLWNNRVNASIAWLGLIFVVYTILVQYCKFIMLTEEELRYRGRSHRSANRKTCKKRFVRASREACRSFIYVLEPVLFLLRIFLAIFFFVLKWLIVGFCLLRVCCLNTGEDDDEEEEEENAQDNQNNNNNDVASDVADDGGRGDRANRRAAIRRLDRIAHRPQYL